MEKFLKVKKYLLLATVLILLCIFSFIYYQKNYLIKSDEIINDNSINKFSEDITSTPTTNITTKIKQYFDIKGAVKNPGVYSFDDEDKIIDAINKAGGLTKNGTTENINLSQKIKSEMVIYIFTKNELITTKNYLTTTNSCKCEVIEVNNCINNDNKEESNIDDIIDKEDKSKININTANINELTTISGIGESKAKAIIDYRINNGLFKSIEELKNVSGLGDALFDKIKDFITI